MNNNQFSSSSFEKQPRGTNNGITEPISILHVDDEEAFLKATQIYVEESTERKIKVDSLIDAEKVFRRLEEKAYDVIITDYRMPKIDGLQLLKQLREKNISIPLIIFTGRGREEVAIQALNLGANRYIKKGMDLESQFGELIHAIQEVVRHKQTTERLKESEERLRSFMDASPHSFLLFDDELNLIDLNKGSLLRFPPKTKREELLGKNIKELSPETEKTDYLFDQYQKILETGESIQVEDYVSHPVYGERTFEVRAFKVGNGLGIIASDVTEHKQKDEDLRESEEKYKMLVEKLDEGVLLEDTEGKISFVNPKTTELLGYTEKELVGKPWTYIVPPKSVDKARSESKKRFKGISSSYEIDLLAKDNTLKPVIVSATPIYSESEEFDGVLSVFTDLTKQKQAEKELRENEEKYRFFIKNFQGIAYRGYDDFSTDLFSGNIEEITGYNEEDLISGKIVYNQLIHPEDSPRIKSEVADFMSSSKRSTEREYRIIDKKGKIHWIQDYVQKFFNEARGIGGVYGTIQDMTVRKQAEEALQESEERLRAFIYSATDAIDLWDSDLNLIDCNQAVLDNFPNGTKKEILIGKNIAEIIPDIKETDRYDRYIDVLRTGKPYHLESFDSHPKFGDRVFSVQAVKVGDGLGMITRDVTERKQAEESLRESKEKYQMLVEKLEEGVLLEDADGIITFVNPRALKRLGYSEEEVIGKHWSFTSPPEDLKRYQDETAKRPKEISSTYESGILSKKGLRIPVIVSATPLHSPDGEYLGTLSVFRDISKRKKAESQLRESEIRYRKLFEESPVSLWEEDFSKVFSYLASLKELGIRDFRKYFTEHPEVVSKCASLVKILDVNQATLDLYKAKSKDEVIENLNRVFVEESFDTFREELIALAEGATRFSIETTGQNLKGEKIHADLGLSISTGYGDPSSRVLISILDVTKRKQAEEALRAVNEELQAFASIVAHDLKSPLSNIKTIVELLVRDSVDALSEKGKDYLNLMVKQTTHMAALIDGIHQYSHIDRLQKKVEHINLKELLPEVIEIVSPPANIEIVIQTELPVLAVDRTHMIQIFTNLLGNAVKFMDKPKGSININHEEKETYWQFSVKDNGPGIEERQFKRIFQIFQTLSTKDKAKGTGIGLSIVKKVVEMNGGKVWLESTVGEGSTFYFTLLKELRKKK